MAEEWSVPIYSVEAIRAAENRALAHATEAELMDVAAHAVARTCMHVLRDRHQGAEDSQIVILVGAGNNGGDALLAGVHLVRAGAHVTAVLCADRVNEHALADFSKAGGHVLHADGGHDIAPAVRTVQEATMVIDGIVGLGAQPGLRKPADTLVAS
ncbi:MAG: NAD(P)H-hydrate epimerase, partial [Demequina sp.]